MLRRLALITGAIAVAVGHSAGVSLAAGHLDARTLVAQPRDVGGIRVVIGSWNELGDDGVYPLADALGTKTVPPHLALLAGYSGVAGAALGADVNAMAVVLPDTAAARRLLADTRRVEGFVGGVGVDISKASPPGAADAAVAGASSNGATAPPGQVAITAWTKGALYGYVSATGPHAGALVARVAAAQEARFERALRGERLAFDALVDPVTPVAPYPPEPGRVIHPSKQVPRIARAGRYTLRSLGIGPLTFSPARGDNGFQFPIVLALPPTHKRWLWRITTHVVVKLAPRAPLGRVEISPHIGQTGAPGASFTVARDLTGGRSYLVEETKHTATTTSIEVEIRAMMGRSPAPRERALFGIAASFLGAEHALESVTVLPDSAIEVFDDASKIGCCAITTSVSKAVP
jgi:hypothetical protein